MKTPEQDKARAYERGWLGSVDKACTKWLESRGLNQRLSQTPRVSRREQVADEDDEDHLLKPQ